MSSRTVIGCTKFKFVWCHNMNHAVLNSWETKYFVPYLVSTFSSSKQRANVTKILYFNEGEEVRKTETGSENQFTQTQETVASVYFFSERNMPIVIQKVKTQNKNKTSITYICTTWWRSQSSGRYDLLLYSWENQDAVSASSAPRNIIIWLWIGLRHTACVTTSVLLRDDVSLISMPDRQKLQAGQRSVSLAAAGIQ